VVGSGDERPGPVESEGGSSGAPLPQQRQSKREHQVDEQQNISTMLTKVRTIDPLFLICF
jgi:hypothetical protein